jgi:hypothetical protein
VSGLLRNEHQAYSKVHPCSFFETYVLGKGGLGDELEVEALEHLFAKRRWPLRTLLESVSTKSAGRLRLKLGRK